MFLGTIIPSCEWHRIWQLSLEPQICGRCGYVCVIKPVQGRQPNSRAMDTEQVDVTRLSPSRIQIHGPHNYKGMHMPERVDVPHTSPTKKTENRGSS